MKLRRFARNKGVRLIWLALAATDTARTPRAQILKCMYVVRHTAPSGVASPTVTSAQRNICNRTNLLNAPTPLCKTILD